MARSLNKVSLIGNLTRDPELRYTPQGNAVCTLGVATNRQWTTDTGEKKEETDFHRIVAWNKLAEICAQLLRKGRKVYVEGRLQNRSWTAQDGTQRTTTEIVISDMIILDSRREPEQGLPDFDVPDTLDGEAAVSKEVSQEPKVTEADSKQTQVKSKQKSDKKKKKVKAEKESSDKEAKDEDDEIPF